MLINTIEWFEFDLINYYIKDPQLNFGYPFLPVPIFSKQVLGLIMYGMALSTILIIIGRFVRIAALYFGLAFAYFFLIDQTFYNNHYYLIILISGMLVFMRSDEAFVLGKKSAPTYIEAWQYWLLRFQVMVVYFFGGVAKMNPYWLDHEPAKTLLEMKALASGISYVSSQPIVLTITYGGLVFDLLIGFALLYKPTQKLGIVAAILFNVMNAWLFHDISIFPYFMLGALILFINPNTVHEWLKEKKLAKKPLQSNESKHLSGVGMIILSLYMVLQITLPIRHYFIPGYTDWTGEGQRFSWRMKIQTRIYNVDEISFIIDTGEGQSIIDVRKYINDDQYHQMLHSPLMVVQFAQFIEAHAKENFGFENVEIAANIPIEFNGQPKAFMFYPNTNILESHRRNDSFYDWMPPAPGLD
ncbi:MAG: HTTM domain-containing protein [Salibacteraceae bacterium]